MEVSDSSVWRSSPKHPGEMEQGKSSPGSVQQEPAGATASSPCRAAGSLLAQLALAGTYPLPPCSAHPLGISPARNSLNKAHWEVQPH